MFNDMSLSKNSNFKTKIYAKYKKTEASVSALHKVQEPVNPMTALEYYEGSDKLMIAAINNGSEQWNAYVKKLRAKASCELIIISNLDCERINFAQYDLANIAFRDSSFHVCSFNKSIISNLQFVNADLRCVNLSEPNWSDEAKADARLRTIIISQSKIHNSNIHPPDEVDTVKITHSQIVKTSIGFSFANDITWYDNSFEECTFHGIDGANEVYIQNTFDRCSWLENFTGITCEMRQSRFINCDFTSTWRDAKFGQYPFILGDNGLKPINCIFDNCEMDIDLFPRLYGPNIQPYIPDKPKHLPLNSNQLKDTRWTKLHSDPASGPKQTIIDPAKYHESS